MHRKLLTGAVVVGVALGAAGCGDDEEPLTRAGFRQRANAICAEFARESQALITETLDGARVRREESGNAPLAVVRDELVAQRQREIDALRALSPPDNVEEAYGQMVDSMAAGVELIPSADDMAADRDPQARRRLAQEGKTRGAARRAGLSCG
jgi:hypothetical protein